MHVSINGIKKRYGKREVLKDITFEASEGECVGIIGRNGCGKSTLLSVLSGVIGANHGEFLIDGKDVIKDEALRHRTVAYVPQGTPVIEELSAYDNLRMWYMPEALDRELKSGFLKILGIDEFLKLTVNKMSVGMKKRLSIGCAINNNPSVLLLDEPTAALDIVCREAVYAYLDAFKKSGGILILATHDTREIEMCDVCKILKEGTLTPYSYEHDVADLLKSI